METTIDAQRRRFGFFEPTIMAILIFTTPIANYSRGIFITESWTP